MVYGSGGIYLVRGVQEKNSPVVVLDQSGNTLRVIQISSKKHINNQNAWIMRTLIKETPVIVSLKFDKILKIPTSDIITQLGQISSEEIAEIRDKVREFEQKGETLDTSGSEQEIKEYGDKIKLSDDYFIEIKDMLTQLNSPTARWKERIFAFLFGLIASGIVTAIAELL